VTAPSLHARAPPPQARLLGEHGRQAVTSIIGVRDFGALSRAPGDGA
jgi:hypothetical protein